MLHYNRRRTAALLAAALCSLATGCQQAPTLPPANIIVHRVAKLPSDPADPAWDKVQVYDAKLVLQDLVEPRLLAESTPSVRVQALSEGENLAIRLQWDDPSPNDMPGPARFFDACAIQLPTDIQPTVPAPQMGEHNRPVHISFWNASWQAMVDGRKDSLSAIYPQAAIDHYPFDAESLKKDPAAQEAMEVRYAPAKALGNFMAGPRESAVQDLLAEGPSTLSAATEQVSSGGGVRTPSGWSVLIIRPLPVGFSADHPTQIALAVWRGESGEVGARKMRSAWIPLTQEAAP